MHEGGSILARLGAFPPFRFGDLRPGENIHLKMRIVGCLIDQNPFSIQVLRSNRCHWDFIMGILVSNSSEKPLLFNSDVELETTGPHWAKTALLH
jgi:hypothetical protein